MGGRQDKPGSRLGLTRASDRPMGPGLGELQDHLHVYSLAR